MTGLFGGGADVPKPPPKPLSEPKMTDPEVEEARRQARMELRKKRGRAATIVTGGQGLSAEAPVRRKTLLGE